MVSDLPIVTPPKPPGSRQLISPPLAVFEIAPANVLQGAVRLQGFASSPTPETQVLVACPIAEAGSARATSARAGPALKIRREVFMCSHYVRSRRKAIRKFGAVAGPF